MPNFKTMVAATAVMLTGLAVQPAMAASVATVNGVTFPIGIIPGGNSLQTGFLDETLITGVGQTLQGIGLITAITDASNNIVWSTGQNGVELAFHFNNYVSTSITAPTSSAPGQVTFSGGVLDFFTLSAGTAINGNGSQAADFAVVTSGTPWLSATAALEDAAGHTLLATLPANSTLTAFQAASGFGLLDITGGPAAAYFNTNQFANPFDTANGGFSDQSFTSDFSTGASGDFPVSGSGTIKANASAPTPAPEPAAIGMFGVGLLGLGVVMGRRRSA